MFRETLAYKISRAHAGQCTCQDPFDQDTCDYLGLVYDGSDGDERWPYCAWRSTTDELQRLFEYRAVS